MTTDQTDIQAVRAEAESLRAELARVRAASDERTAELERRLGWVEENELYLEELVARSRLAAAVVGAWARARRLQRRVKRKLRS
ncbi:MAG: hypothetical protein HZB14_02900 [Actinobacteria bacterium]|nr:hypothetical protein [Actinomycetota bacterium]